tara:strand:+ start:651 stop:941 length:291 start_codon:yes stop_codon:yes gene_type:complete
MKKILPLLIIMFLNHCTSLDEAGRVLRNEKTNSTDEFLIKKNDPLSIPPKLEELPEPRSNNKTSKKSESIFNSKSENKNKKTSEIEKLIIEEIKSR